MELGKKVRCIITGFEGIAYGKAEYLDGCVKIMVKPKGDAKNKYPESEWLDIDDLEVVGEGIEIPEKQATGGPNKKHDAPK